MIAYMCLIEASINWNALMQLYNPCYVSCYIGFEKTLPILLFGTVTYEKAVNILCFSNRLFFEVAQIISVSMNICLCIDVVLQI